MPSSSGRKTVAVARGLVMLCETCYDHVVADSLVDGRNYVADHEALFDVICPGCTDINRPLIDDMLGSSE
jgi:spermidine synthase